MANTYAVQTLVDGPRNVVIKVSGILDTSDISVSAGQIGSAGFTTTIGSTIIQFTAGALAPTVGQYLTFGDGTTTFPAGTYVISITDATHIVVNTPALATNAAAAITITGVAGQIVLIDPAFLSGVDIAGSAPTRLVVDKVYFNIASGLAVNLYWGATADVLMLSLTPGEELEFKSFGGLWNNAGAGITGRINYSTQGWGVGTTLPFTLILEMRKK